jgi:CRISPR/Cas system-associated exonuclease Cas4 (RecB family)
MIPFLKLVAQDIAARFTESMEDVTLVFPNRRSILYFNRYLSQVVAKPVWAPQCVTISNYIEGFSSLRKADDLLLLFDLYKVYCKVRKTSETFDNFYYWGELMLSDFDDIDKYLVDAESLFKNLSALKNINEQFSYLDENQVDAIKLFWKNFEQSKQSTHQKEFSDLWISMYAIYKEFRELISKKDLAYEGMIYRELADSIQRNTFPEITVKKIALVGFNALNECEKVLFQNLKASGKALFYWDYDQEYLDKMYHEAGFFIRKNLEDFPSALPGNLFTNYQNPGKIEVIAVPSLMGQAKVANEIISRSVGLDQNPDNTAILLTDENMLMTVLHSIPENIEEINITMGFPVKNAPIISLIESVGNLHNKARIAESTQEAQYYYKHFLDVVAHPYVSRFDPELLSFLERKILTQNLIYIKEEHLPHSILKDILFKHNSNSAAFINQLAELVKFIGRNSFADKEEIAEQPEGIESETLMVVYSAINRFADLLSQSEITLDAALAFRLLMKVLNGLTVPFEGEPLKGIQVMGFLESRSLDFQNIIILGVNEGNLPKTNIPVSFIPYNLRHGFGLPTLEFRDAMYAYYFYRILQRAENAFLIYNTRADKMGSSEVSRYITQLQYSGKHQIIQKVQTFTIVPPEPVSISIAKTPELLKILDKFLDRPENKSYLSPSALSSYIDCSLRFYYRYVAGIKEYEIPTEEIDASMLGNILHAAMQVIYEPYKGKSIDKAILDGILKDKKTIDNAIQQAMRIQFFKEPKSTAPVELLGRNLIIYRILQKYVRRIIHIDIQQAPFTLIDLEKNVSTVISLESNSRPISIRIGGNIDRIDQTQLGIKIIDYKTGSIEYSSPSLDELFISPEKKKSKKELFQTILYCLVYQQSSNTDKFIVPALYGLRKIFNEQFDSNIYIDKTAVLNIQSIAQPFLEKLKELLSEIYNENQPFEQTADVSKCSYCAYNEICRR